MKRLPSIERLREAFRHDSGSLFWRIGGPRRKVGAMAGTSKTNRGYYQVCLDGHVMLSHRVIWALIHGRWPKDQIDHVNRDRSDNRPSNLREADQTQQNANCSLSRRSSTGRRGVTTDKRRGKFIAQIKHAGRHIYLGQFDCPDEAHAAYAKASLEMYGEFAAVNVQGPQ